jgi:hypothetical protein
VADISRGIKEAEGEVNRRVNLKVLGFLNKITI